MYVTNIDVMMMGNFKNIYACGIKTNKDCLKTLKIRMIITRCLTAVSVV